MLLMNSNLDQKQLASGVMQRAEVVSHGGGRYSATVHTFIYTFI